MTTVAFDSHARTISLDLSLLTKEFIVELHRETHLATLQAAIAATPVRTGGMKAAWTSAPANFESAMKSMRPTKVRNAHPAAVIIDMGRRASENAWNVRLQAGGTVVVATRRRRKDGSYVHRRRAAYYTVKPGKMLGSTQAPRGIKGPVFRDVEQQEEAIFRRAAATVERKGDR